MSVQQIVLIYLYFFQPSLNGVVEGSQLPITQLSQSQPIGEDILALCTGKFYDNEFISPPDEKAYVDEISQDLVNNDLHDTQTANSAANDAISKEVEDIQSLEPTQPPLENHNEEKTDLEESKKAGADTNLLKSILDELDDPEFDKPKENKFFTGGTQNKVTKQAIENTLIKKKFTIDSDDDEAETNEEVGPPKKKKLKKRKPEKRALQISGIFLHLSCKIETMH